MKKLIYLSALLFIVACASKKTQVPAPSSSTHSSSSSTSIANTTTLNQLAVRQELTESNFKTTVKDFTFADFQKGKTLYESKCNGCHDLIPPTAKPTDLWIKIVPVMVNKYNMKNTDVLDGTAVNYISGYLVTASTK